jgi:hypothetical protein
VSGVLLKILHPWPCASDAVQFLRAFLREVFANFFANHLAQRLSFCEYSEQTCHGSKKGNTFYEGRSEDHVSTNVVRSFGLAGDGFYSAFTDLSDTDTGTYSGEACANCAITRLYSVQQCGHQHHDSWVFIIKKKVI